MTHRVANLSQFFGRLARRSRAALPPALAALPLLCVAAAAFSSLRNHPHSIAYFNEVAGGPGNGWRHMLGSSFDWGQDWLQLLARTEAAGLTEKCRLWGAMSQLDPAWLDHRLKPSRQLNPSLAMTGNRLGSDVSEVFLLLRLQDALKRAQSHPALTAHGFRVGNLLLVAGVQYKIVLTTDRQTILVVAPTSCVRIER